MALLLAVIYIAFIGLGVPDSLIGSAWPAIYAELGVPDIWVSAVTLTISGCTVLSGIVSTPVLERYGTAKVTVFSTAMTALSMLGFSFSHRFLFLILLAVPLGLGAGAIDSGLNNYIALHYKASHMNFLHCFYGIGVSCSPYLMSLAISGSSWRSGYRYACAIQTAITLILVLSLPLWKKAGAGTEIADDGQPGESIPFPKLLRRADVRTMWLVMVATNAIEYACGTWGSTYLVQAHALPAGRGAALITLFYIGMACGRFLAGLIADRLPIRKTLPVCLGIVLAAVLLMLLPLPEACAYAGLFLIGLGNGPVYPVLLHETPVFFGRGASQSVMGSEIAAAYTGVMITPPVFGFVSRLCGIGSFPSFLLFLLVLLTFSLLRFRKKRL